MADVGWRLTCVYRVPALYVSCQGICMLGTVVYIVYISPCAMCILGLYHKQTDHKLQTVVIESMYIEAVSTPFLGSKPLFKL